MLFASLKNLLFCHIPLELKLQLVAFVEFPSFRNVTCSPICEYLAMERLHR